MAPGMVARMVLCSLVVLAGTGHAERPPVAVIDLSAADPAKELSDALYKALVDHAGLRPLDAPTLIAALRGPFVDEEGAYLRRAQQYKQQADDALSQLDDRNAAIFAGNGMAELAFVQPSPEMLGLYAELAFAYGQAQIGLRKPNDASLAFQLAHRLDPAHSPDRTRYPPNIVAAFNAAAVKPTIAAKVAIKGEGRVWIDGVEQGPAGATFDTSEGLHLVQLTGPDRETRGEQALVPLAAALNIVSAPATEELKVKRARIAMSRARDPAERASAIKRLAALLGVRDAVLITKNTAGELTVQTWRDREPGFSALVVHRDEKPVELLRPLAPPALKVEKSFEPVPDPPPIVIEERWHQKTWIRASIAGGVIAGIVGAILYARRDQTLPPLDMDPQWKEPP